MDKSVTYMVQSAMIQPTGAVGEALMAATRVSGHVTTPQVESLMWAACDLAKQDSVGDVSDDDLLIAIAEWAEAHDRRTPADLAQLEPYDRKRIIRRYDVTYRDNLPLA